MMNTVCRKCFRELSLDKFGKNKQFSDGLRSECKECRNKYAKWLKHNNKEYAENQKNNHKKWAANNKEKLRKYRVDWSRRKPTEKAKNKHYYSNYGLSIEEVNALIDKQGGKCRLCQKVPEDKLCVDHCHTTGKVRGMLCRKCNLMLGLINDSKIILKNAIDYLGVDYEC